MCGKDRMRDKYILRDGKPEPFEGDFMEWAEWFEKADRHVAQDELPGGVRVSTVFLGVDHSFGGPEPLLFETMIFGGKLDQEQWRYSTREEAEAGHAAALALAKIGTDRLVEPAIKASASSTALATEEETEEPSEIETEKRRKTRDSGGEEYHPFIQGLLTKLPPPDSDWPMTWFRSSFCYNGSSSSQSGISTV